MILSNGSILHGRYAVQSVLGDVGPFDVNYLAWDLQAEREVVVREYYPLRLAQRGRDGATLEVNDPRLFEYGLGAYLAEGALLMDIRHAGVVTCTDQFKENGTVYRVNAYVSGASLAAYIRQHQGRIGEEDAISVVQGVLGALEACHARRLFHAGITPKSIYMTVAGPAVLLGFQSARFKLARRCEAVDEALHPGFSPPELAGGDAPDGPWWDVYGCAATLLFMLSGRVPPAITIPSEAGRIQTALHRASGLSAELRGVLERAMAFHPADRPATADAFGALLAEVGTRRLRPSAARPMLHVGIDLEEASSDALWHSDIELVAATPYERSEPSAPILSSTQKAERPMPRESSDIISSQPPSYALSNGHDREPASPARESSREPRREHELELLVVKMVKWQQVFVGSILAIVFLAMIGVIGGVFFAPGVAQRLMASDPGGSIPEAQAAPAVVAPLMAATTVDSLAAAIPAAEALAEDEGVEFDLYEPEPIAAVIESVTETVVDEPAAPEVAPTREAVSREIPARDVLPEPVPEIEAPAVAERVAPEPEEPEPEPEPAVAAPPPVSPEVLAAQIRREQYTYYRAQGDSLIRLGFYAAALHLYQSAQRIEPTDAYVATQLATIETQLQDDARQREIADSLKVRIGKVTDGEGYFVAPDTPVAVVEEPAMRRAIRYPFAASQASITGRVTVQYLVDANGRFVTARVVNGIGGGCDEEVVRALREARFAPATFNGQPVVAWARFSVVFGGR
ncbi:MAG: TonB family protein [Rhodothermales bacterium]|nr:TonB family protein [Rhodothermales bacterium]